MFQVRAETRFDFLSSVYRRLYESSAATAFQHPVWLDCLYRHLAPAAGAEPLVVTASREDGSLALVLPLLRRRRKWLRTLEFADLGVSDYAGPVCTAPTLRAIGDDPWARAQLRRALGRFHLMRVPKVRGDGTDLARLLGGATRVPMEGRAHAVRLAPPFARWRTANMDASLCRELDKKRRKLARKGSLTFERLADPAAIAETFRRSEELRRPRFEERGRTDILADPAALAFYIDVATSGMAEGFARTYALALDGKTIATLFGIRRERRLMVLVTAFDGGFRKLSLGNLLFEDVIADCIASGDEVFDLTIGDEGYKKDFGTVPTELTTVLRGGSLVGHLASRLLSRRWGSEIVKGLVRA